VFISLQQLGKNFPVHGKQPLNTLTNLEKNTYMRYFCERGNLFSRIVLEAQKRQKRLVKPTVFIKRTN